MRGSPVLAVLMAGSALCVATGVAAQDTCDLLQSRSSTVRMTRDAVFNYISQPVFGCDGGAIIRADSAELNDVSNSTRFIGNFEYRDSTAFMIADRADHFASEGRLIGVGNVHITDEATGAVFEGDSAVLVGSSSRREGGELTIMGRDGRRAHAVILVSPQAVAPDSSETAPDSMVVAGDSMVVAGDSVMVAGDSVMVAGDSVAAGDSGPVAPDSAQVATEASAADSGLVASDSTQIATDSTQVATGAPASAADSGPVAPDSAQVATEASAADSGLVASDPTQVATEVPAAPADSTPPVPYDIDAQHIYLRGEGYMLASGDAELYNEEFRALADSIEYRRGAGKLFLRGSAPRVNGFGAEYVLSGGAVDIDMDGSQITARNDAALAGREIDLTAPEIRVLMRDGALDRIVAMMERPAAPGEPALADGEPALADGEPTGGEGDASPTEPGDSAAALPPARPRAVAETFELEGDSIDVQAPGEVLDRVVAVGGARGESLARDSLNTEDTPEIARSDWVAGDTITAIFTPAASPGTPPEAGAGPVADEAEGGYQLDRLVARGEAASLYRMSPPPDDGGEEGEAEAGGEGDGNAPEGEAETEQPAAGEEAPAADVALNPEADPERESAETTATAQPAAPAEAEDDPPREGEEEAARAEEPPESRLALHYVRGDLITIFMRDGEVTSVAVEGAARGVQLEPVAPPPPDTTAAPPSTRR